MSIKFSTNRENELKIQKQKNNLIFTGDIKCRDVNE